MQKVSRDMTDLSETSKASIFDWKLKLYTYYAFSTILAIVTTFFYTPFCGMNEDMFFAIWFFKTYIKPYNNYLFHGLRISYYFSYLGLSYTMNAHIFFFIYLCLKLIVPNSMLAEFIQNINNFEFVNKDRLDLVFNEDYQEKIYYRLKYCIQMHQKIVK